MGWTDVFKAGAPQQQPKPDLTASDLVKVIWGDRDRPASGLGEALITWLDEPHPDFPNRNAQVIRDRLAGHGYQPEQVAEIRDKVVESFRAVTDLEIKRGALPEKYLSALGDNFGVYTPYLNVSDEERERIGERARALAERKLQDLPYVRAEPPAAAPGPARRGR